MRKIVVLAVFVCASLSGFAQERESRFGIELDGGVSYSFTKLDEAEMKVGGGFEFTLHYRIYNHVGAYAGWGWNHFAAKNSFAGMNCDFEETGYVFGLQFKHAIGDLPASYYVRAGGLWNHIEIENGDDIIMDTKHGWGYQIAGGVYFPIGKTWSINTGVKFNSLNRENIEFADYGKRSFDLKYVSLRVGFLKMF
jgi:opacity protein-like surface antigen